MFVLLAAISLNPATVKAEEVVIDVNEMNGMCGGLFSAKFSYDPETDVVDCDTSSSTRIIFREGFGALLAWATNIPSPGKYLFRIAGTDQWDYNEVVYDAFSWTPISNTVEYTDEYGEKVLGEITAKWSFSKGFVIYINKHENGPADTDEDGILDDEDLCPYEYAATEKDANSDGCIDSIDDMAAVVQELIEGLDLPGGVENSLLAKVDGAVASADKGMTNAAANKLHAFIHSVHALSGKKIPPETEAALTGFAYNVIESLN
jgi:hypothetical protein